MPPQCSPTLPEKAEQILAAAMAVFLDGGYRGSSLDRIAAAAGVSKHTIYSHFDSKQGLFTALIERLVLRRFYLEIGETLPETTAPEQVLAQLADILLELRHSDEYIAFVRLLIAESGRFPELAQLYAKTVIQRGNQVLADYLVQRLGISEDVAQVRSHIFWGSLVAYILSQEVLHGKETMPIATSALKAQLIPMVLAASP